MQLYEFFNYKNKLMEDLLTSPEIVALINEDATVSNAKSKLRYKQVFPYEYLPETSDTAKTYVCFDVDIRSVSNKNFLVPVLYIWIFTHKSLLRLPKGGIRIDQLSSEISNKINGSRDYGLGSLDLQSADRFAPTPEYQGRVLTFYTTDFNRFYDPSRTPPLKRR